MRFFCLPLTRRKQRRDADEDLLLEEDLPPPQPVLSTVTRTTTQTWEPARPGEDVTPTRVTTIEAPLTGRVQGQPRPLSMDSSSRQQSIIVPQVPDLNTLGLGFLYNDADYSMVSHTTTGVVNFETRAAQRQRSPEYNSVEHAQYMARRLSRRVPARHDSAAGPPPPWQFPAPPVGELEAHASREEEAVAAGTSHEQVTEERAEGPL